MNIWELVVRFAPTVLGIVVVPCGVMVGFVLIANAIRPSQPRGRR